MSRTRALFAIAVTAVVPSTIAEADPIECIPFVYEAAIVSWAQTTVDGEPDPTFAPEIESMRVDASGDLVVMFAEGRNGYVLTLDAPQ